MGFQGMVTRMTFREEGTLGYALRHSRESGYPSTGCTPAEPASVSPDIKNIIVHFTHINLIFLPYLVAAQNRKHIERQ